MRGRQEKMRRDARGVDPERAGRRVAEAVHLVQRVADIAQRRSEPFEQAPAGLRQRDAARGAVEQADAQALLQPADRVAHCGCRQAGFGARALKARGARDGGENGEMGKGRLNGHS